jgi:predicted PurR-regulated permease PerM
MKMTRLNTFLFLFIFSVVGFFNIYIFLPILNSLIFAGILAGAFYPIFQGLQLRLGLRKNTAASVTTFLVVILILLPIIYISIQVSKEAYAYYLNFQTGQLGGIKDFFFGDGVIGTMVTSTLNFFEIGMTNEEVYSSFLEWARSLSGILFTTINEWLSNTLNFLLSFIIMILAIYSLFVEGENLKNFLFVLSPLPNDQEEHIMSRFNQMNFAILIGNGVGGVIQGVLAGLALWIMGFPSVFLLTSLMVILAFIPLLGISIVTIPIAIITFFNGSKAVAIIFIIYSTIISLGVENWFKPKFIGSRVEVNSLLLLFYIIGGMAAFGVVGIFYGPIFAIIFLTMSEIFMHSYLPNLQMKK